MDIVISNLIDSDNVTGPVSQKSQKAYELMGHWPKKVKLIEPKGD